MAYYEIMDLYHRLYSEWEERTGRAEEHRKGQEKYRQEQARKKALADELRRKLK